MTHVQCPPIKHWRTSLERLEKFICSDNLFSDSNLTAHIETDIHQFCQLPHFTCKGRPTFDQVSPAKSGSFVQCDLASKKFGPTWSTHWFKLVIPSGLLTCTQTVALKFKCDCEALLYSVDGRPIQSFSDERSIFKIPTQHSQKEDVEYFVELACNGMFGAGNHCIGPPDADKEFSVKVSLVSVDEVSEKLLLQLTLLHDLANNLGKDSIPGTEALYLANDCINNLLRSNFSSDSCLSCSTACDQWLTSGVEGDKSRLTVHAVGHCHIDTAWLWPYQETERKCARSWANQIALMEKNPQFTFTCSQAQQCEWVEKRYPNLFSEIQSACHKGQFLPVGGSWVEMDGNLPSCESFCRQFLLGQTYFKRKFGKYSEIFWLPDTFGYSACIPQMCNQAGMKYFVTQKLSWNLVNKFPHNTFRWIGQDGSELLTHFPPNDDYCARMKPSELTRSEANFRDKGRSRHSLLLFGHGDGGGGPTEAMVASMHMMSHVPGLPYCKPSSPEDFFAQVEGDRGNLCVHRGELYFELHQGTFTTQSNIKQQNNRMEQWLTQLEFALATLTALGQLSGHRLQERVEEAWKLVLCNQFHDVLPGSCIEQVVQDASGYYQRATRILCDVSADICRPTTDCCKTKANMSDCALCDEAFFKMRLADSLRKDDGIFELENRYLSVEFGSDGVIRSLKCADSDLNLASSLGVNRMVIYSDMPLFWDAWDVMDYHLETGDVISADHCGEEFGGLQFNYKIGEKSSATLEVILPNDKPYLEFDLRVDWRESRKLLKVEFDFNLPGSMNKAFYGSQIGFVERSTSVNTSYDTAQFEVCGHKWAAIQQHGAGCAVLSPAKYGWRGHNSSLSLSLLRSPKAPDANADMGEHRVAYALMPYTGTFQSAGVQRQSVRFAEWVEDLPCNIPVPRHIVNQPIFRISTEAVQLSAFKLSQDSSGYILRVKEVFGSCTHVQITSLLQFRSYQLVDILERPLEANVMAWEPEKGLQFSIQSFKLVSFLLK